MPEDLEAALGLAATFMVEPVDGAAIRKRAEGRRRRSAAILAVGILLVVAIPVVGLLVGRQPAEVLLEQPATPLSSNPTVYRVTVDVDVRVTGDLAGVVQAVIPEYGGPPSASSGGNVILTSPVQAQLDLTAATADTRTEARVARIENGDVTVDEATTSLVAGLPTLLTADVHPTDGSDADPFYPETLDQPITGALPVVAQDGRTGVVEITLTPRPQTGDALGIPGPTDLPDQRLPRPAVGEALPEMLADGRPVWVVGLDDGQVAVIDARSSHTVSGLVGWCATLPGFTDVPGASRFDAAGGYAFGPAPHGLTTYAVDVAADHVTVTGQLPPQPRPGLIGQQRQIPPIEGSPVAQGPICALDPVAFEEGREDYHGDPHWLQHDLASWPQLDGQADGWFRTDQAIVPEQLVGGAPVLVTGDLLAHRIDGQTVDAAGPPGTTTRQPVPTDQPPPPILQLLAGLTDDPTEDCPAPSCPHGTATLIPVIWVTPTDITPVTDDPPPPGAVLYPNSPNPAHDHSPRTRRSPHPPATSSNTRPRKAATPSPPSAAPDSPADLRGTPHRSVTPVP